jgi:hypothetical protein
VVRHRYAFFVKQIPHNLFIVSLFVLKEIFLQRKSYRFMG